MSNFYRLNTSRGLLKFIIFSFFTCGIYMLIYFASISSSLNKIAAHDGKKTMNYFLVFLLDFVTFFIADLVWFHKMSKRVGNELARRRISYSFGSGSYWGWCIIGFLFLCGIGPLVYIHKLSVAMNLLCADYNERM